jgi:hypothetical protein
VRLTLLQHLHKNKALSYSSHLAYKSKPIRNPGTQLAR